MFYKLHRVGTQCNDLELMRKINYARGICELLNLGSWQSGEHKPEQQKWDEQNHRYNLIAQGGNEKGEVIQCGTGTKILLQAVCAGEIFHHQTWVVYYLDFTTKDDPCHDSFYGDFDSEVYRIKNEK